MITLLVGLGLGFVAGTLYEACRRGGSIDRGNHIALLDDLYATDVAGTVERHQAHARRR
ncbi:MAG: hypothetical protein JWM93_4001 [Frankiales bacterium]|nr:hypothetical protein [Frankiales bacterium]